MFCPIQHDSLFFYRRRISLQQHSRFQTDKITIKRFHRLLKRNLSTPSYPCQPLLKIEGGGGGIWQSIEISKYSLVSRVFPLSAMKEIQTISDPGPLFNVVSHLFESTSVILSTFIRGGVIQG